MINAKIGDKIRVTKKNTEHCWYKVGEEHTVVGYDICREYCGVVVENMPGHFIHDGCYEVIPKTFTKADLKDGMRIWNRNGDTYLYDGIDFHFKSRSGYLRLQYFDDELFYFARDHKYADIMKVSQNGEVIWEREEESPAQKELKKLKEQATALNEQIKKLEETIK